MAVKIIPIGVMGRDTLTVEVDFAREIALLMGWPLPGASRECPSALPKEET